MPIAYLSELMGHSDIQTTRDAYLKFRDDDIKEADRRYRPIL
jgi:integrase/recombinase XerD